MLYPVIVHKDEDSGWGVTVPDVPGCFTSGATREEALAGVQEAVECHLSGGECLPPPSTPGACRLHPDFPGGEVVLVDIDPCLGG